MRLSYTPKPLPVANAEVSTIIKAICARRYLWDLAPLDLGLLHSPYIASAWNGFLDAIRK